MRPIEEKLRDLQLRLRVHVWERARGGTRERDQRGEVCLAENIQMAVRGNAHRRPHVWRERTGAKRANIIMINLLAIGALRALANGNSRTRQY